MCRKSTVFPHQFIHLSNFIQPAFVAEEPSEQYRKYANIIKSESCFRNYILKICYSLKRGLKFLTLTLECQCYKSIKKF